MAGILEDQDELRNALLRDAMSRHATPIADVDPEAGAIPEDFTPPAADADIPYTMGKDVANIKLMHNAPDVKEPSRAELLRLGLGALGRGASSVAGAAAPTRPVSAPPRASTPPAGESVVPADPEKAPPESDPEVMEVWDRTAAPGERMSSGSREGSPVRDAAPRKASGSNSFDFSPRGGGRVSEAIYAMGTGGKLGPDFFNKPGDDELTREKMMASKKAQAAAKSTSEDDPTSPQNRSEQAFFMVVNPRAPKDLVAQMTGKQLRNYKTFDTSQASLGLRGEQYGHRVEEDTKNRAFKEGEAVQKHSEKAQQLALATSKFEEGKEQTAAAKIQAMGKESAKMAPVVNGLVEMEDKLPAGGFAKMTQDFSRWIGSGGAPEKFHFVTGDQAAYQQAWEQVAQTIRHELYGGALTGDEKAEFAKFLASGSSYTPAALVRGVKLIKGHVFRNLAANQSSLAAKYGKEFDQFRRDTGDLSFMSPLFDDVRPRAPAPTPVDDAAPPAAVAPPPPPAPPKPRPAPVAPAAPTGRKAYSKSKNRTYTLGPNQEVLLEEPGDTRGR